MFRNSKIEPVEKVKKMQNKLLQKLLLKHKIYNHKRLIK